MRSGRLLLLAATVLGGCATSSPDPGDGSSLAKYFEDSLARHGEPVMRHLIGGQVYYYTTSPCCDLVNPLYDSHGKFVCAPDGGFTGRGDGRCPPDVRLDPGSPGVTVPNPFYRR